MRRLIPFLAMLLCLFLLMGCGETRAGSDGNTSDEVSERPDDGEYAVYFGGGALMPTVLVLSKQNEQAWISTEGADTLRNGTYERSGNALTLCLADGPRLSFRAEENTFVFDKTNSVFADSTEEDRFLVGDGTVYRSAESVRENRSGASVSSGDMTVSPFSGMVYTDIYEEAAGGYVSGSGNGVSALLSLFRNASNLCVDAFIPTLTLDGNVTVSVPVNGNVSHVKLIALGDPETGSGMWEESETAVEDLKDLPAGNYYVVLTVTLNGNCDAEAPQNRYCYEDLFRLGVPQK